MKRGQQKKKENRDNLGDNEKEQLRKYEKEGKKVLLITSTVTKKKK